MYNIVKTNTTYPQIEVKKSRKEVIFEEAARLFKEKGYQAASMRELAQRVQLEPSSLYSHIKSKDELLQKICFDCADQFMSGLKAISGDSGTALEKIQKLIELHISIATENPTSITVFNDEWKNLGKEKLVAFKQMRHEYEKQFILLIEDAMRNDHLIKASPEIIFNTIISSVRWIQPGNSHTDKWATRQIKTDITNFIMGGLTNHKYQ
jgi:AcrR family transcriptional regulator